MTKDRNDDATEQTVGALRPKTHSFFDGADCAEHEPEQSDDPSGVEDRGERARPEDTSRTGSDTGDDRHESEPAAAHQKKKRDRLANRGRAHCQPRLVSLRLDRARMSPNESDKPERKQSEQDDRAAWREQSHPGNAIVNRAL